MGLGRFHEAAWLSAPLPKEANGSVDCLVMVETETGTVTGVGLRMEKAGSGVAMGTVGNVEVERARRKDVVDVTADAENTAPGSAAGFHTGSGMGAVSLPGEEASWEAIGP